MNNYTGSLKPTTPVALCVLGGFIKETVINENPEIDKNVFDAIERNKDKVTNYEHAIKKSDTYVKEYRKNKALKDFTTANPCPEKEDAEMFYEWEEQVSCIMEYALDEDCEWVPDEYDRWLLDNTMIHANDFVDGVECLWPSYKCSHSLHDTWGTLSEFEIRLLLLKYGIFDGHQYSLEEIACHPDIQSPIEFVRELFEYIDHNVEFNISEFETMRQVCFDCGNENSKLG